jgi:hypothetical protein
VLALAAIVDVELSQTQRRLTAVASGLLLTFDRALGAE